MAEGGSVERLLRLPKDSLKKSVKTRGKKRGSYNRNPRPQFSRDELTVYMLEKDIKSKRQLIRERNEGEPLPYDYQKEFGSWSEAVKQIWEENDESPPFDREYLIKSIIEFGLWTARDYCKARSKRPDIFPSINQVKCEFGGWNIVKDVARAYSLREVITGYAKLKNKLGKRPTLRDCQRAGVNIDRALEVFGDKRSFDDFIERMEDL